MPRPVHKIAVLGGTGKAGKFLVEELLRRNLSIRMLVRNASSSHRENPLAEIIEGNARSYNSLKTLLIDCDAVVSTLGPSHNEPDTCSLATGNIIRIMHEMHITRYITVAGLAIQTDADKKSLRTRFLIRMMKWFAASVIADRQKEYSLLKNSRLDWTIVRCPMIRQTAGTGKLKIDLLDSPGSSVTASNLAVFICDQLNDLTYAGKAPFIAD